MAPENGNLSIVYRPLRELTPYVRNSRKHSPGQVTKLRASLGRYGWTNPMLIAGNDMVAGHARLLAAIAMAEANEPIAGNADPWAGPTIDLSHLSPADRRAYVIADNRLALDASWDRDMLHAEVSELKLENYDVALTGFAPAELTTLLGVVREARPELTEGMRYQIIVECPGETEQAAMLERLRGENITCRPLIL